MLDDDIAIKVDGVDKDFRLPHEKADSIKSAFTGMLKGKKGRTIERQHALRDITFEIKKGEFFGIVGRNGSGKSTLLKIIAGIYQPTKGKVTTNGRLVPFIELGVGFNPELTGRENVYLNGALMGFSKNEIDSKYKAIVDFAEIHRFMDQKLKNYSSGMQVRLAFSVATILAESDILLIDEVLAVGDADFQRKCFRYFKKLKRDKKTVIFVTHDMNAVREYCDRAALIENSRIVYKGDVTKVAAEYTKMFSGSNQQQTNIYKLDGRWGNQKIRLSDVKITPRNVSDDTETVTVSYRAIASQDTTRPFFGFSISASDGKQLVGTNNVIKKQHIETMSKDVPILIEWTIPNFFNDDEYHVDVTALENDSTPSDWWEDAASFVAYKTEKTPYIIAPKIDLKVKKVDKK
jgi:ABC-2 type transport system ATP-binding protein